MNRVLLGILLCITHFLKSQDKLYFLNGEFKTGVVLEISPNYIAFESEGVTRTVEKSELVMAEFKSGTFEIYNRAPNDLFIAAGPGTDKRLEQTRSKTDTTNLFSINSLALCNADLSLFYEHLFFNKVFGMGGMAGYNFNKIATVFNSNIFPLTNSKKIYDLGFFMNLYQESNIKKTHFTYGLFFKYTEFTFTGVYEDKINSGGVVSIRTRYEPARGSQFATIFTTGTYTRLTQKVFVKTMAGLGGFNLKGTYRQQYNYHRSAGSSKGSDVGFLLKFYFGINAGFNF